MHQCNSSCHATSYTQKLQFYSSSVCSNNGLSDFADTGDGCSASFQQHLALHQQQQQQQQQQEQQHRCSLSQQHFSPFHNYHRQNMRHQRRSNQRMRQFLRDKQRQRFAKIDRFFLVFFPLMFLLFNLLYWVSYYYGQNSDKVWAYVEELVDRDDDYTEH